MSGTLSQPEWLVSCRNRRTCECSPSHCYPGLTRNDLIDIYNGVTTTSKPLVLSSSASDDAVSDLKVGLVIVLSLVHSVHQLVSQLVKKITLT